MGMETKIEKADKSAMQEMRKKEEEERRLHPELYPTYINTRELVGSTITAKIVEIVEKISVGKGIEGTDIINRNLRTEDGKILSMSGMAVVPKIDRFFKGKSLPMTVRMTLTEEKNPKTKKTFVNIYIEAVN